MPEINDLVKFRAAGISEASRFCVKHNLSGKVVTKHIFKVAIDFGLPYLVYADHSDLIVVAKFIDIPECNE